MDKFIQKNSEQVMGILSGFDRLIFRGVLRSINYTKGLDRFLTAHGILLKDFAAFAQQCTKTLAAHAEKIAAQSGRPFIYLASPAVRKDEYARKIAERDGITEGLICVLYAVEPCMTADIRYDRKTHRCEVTYRLRKCRFFYFYYLDREFGMMHARIQSWIPFDLQVYVNGRLHLARQLTREGIPFLQRHNAVFSIGDIDRAQEILDTMVSRHWPKYLNALARRINPLLKTLELTGQFGYYWLIAESEYATDVIFRSPEALETTYPALWQHALTHFSSRDILRFLSGRDRRGMLPNQVVTSHRHRTEGVRVKHCVNENSLKMYDKEGIILRIETTINNPRRFQVVRRRHGVLIWMKMCKGVRDIARRVQICRAANERYLEALAVVGETTPSHRILDEVSQPIRKKQGRYRALRPISPEESRLFKAILHGEHLLDGFTSRRLQRILFPESPRDPREACRRRGWIGRRLCLLRAHGLIRKVSRRNLYRIVEHGHIVMSTALLFRETDVALLAARAA